MARACEPCRFYTNDDSRIQCPKCGSAMRFTLLPGLTGEDPDVTAAAAAAPKTRPASPRQVGIGGLIRENPLPTVGVALCAVVALAALWLFKESSLESRASKVRPGMSMAEAMQIMGVPNKPRPKTKVKISIGQVDDRFPDIDRPLETDGVGYVVFAEGGRGYRIHYQDHVVTGVEECTPEGGLRKRVTYYSP